MPEHVTCKQTSSRASHELRTSANSSLSLLMKVFCNGFHSLLSVSDRMEVTQTEWMHSQESWSAVSKRRSLRRMRCLRPRPMHSHQALEIRSDSVPLVVSIFFKWR